MAGQVMIEELAAGDRVLYPGTESVAVVTRVFRNDPADPGSVSPDPGTDPVVYCSDEATGFSRKFSLPAGALVTIAE